MTTDSLNYVQLRRQVRFAQLMALLSFLGCLAMLADRVRERDHEAVGAARLDMRGVSVGDSVLEHESLRVVSASNTSVQLHANAQSALVGLSTPGGGGVFGIDDARHMVKVGARGRARIELRFNTDTGEVLLARQKDASAAASTETTVQLAPPIVQY